MIEKHYTINELSEQLNMSFERTRQLVKDEPGVLRIPPKSAKVAPPAADHVSDTRERSAANSPTKR